jgi:uncharacterized protein (DUF4415 family)
MKKSSIRTISLEEIRAMKDRGELIPTAPWAEPSDELGPGFWEQAPEIDYHPPTSVHLKLDSFVFDYFKSQGKGHITRMQNVLKAYVLAHTGEKR